MKELSANDMDVWVFDTKRNSNVQRGRQEQEMLNKRRQESIVDLEMDFLAPYLQKFPDINSLTKAQAMEVYINLKLVFDITSRPVTNRQQDCGRN